MSIADEGAGTAQCSPQREGRERHARGCGFPLTESERRPDKRRDTEELQRVIVDVSRQPASEHRLADNDETQDKEQRLQPADPRPSDATVGAPQEEERRHDERAGGVAEPPCQPDRRVVAPTRKPAEGKARDSKRCAHGGADDAGEKSEFENVLRAIECPGTVGEPSDEESAKKCFKRISHRDANGGTV